MKTALSALIATTLCLPVLAAEPSDATVSGILGVAGVKHDTKSKSRQGMRHSDSNYQGADGSDLLTVRLGAADQYALWKQVAAGHTQPVAGIGQEAFAYEGMPMDSVCARSASTAACVTASPLAKGKVTMEQVKAVLKAAL